MSEKIHEQISRLLDDDLPDAELDLLLKQLDKSPQFMQKAVRYQAVSNTMSNGSQFTYSSTVLERVRTHIDNEPNPVVDGNVLQLSSNKTGFFNRALKPMVGAAIAASVAVVTVITYVNTSDSGGLNPASQISAIAQNESLSSPTTQTITPSAVSKQMSPTIARSGIATVSTNGASPKNPAMVLDSQQWDRLPQNMRENVSSYINQHNNYQMVNSNSSRRIIIIEENMRR